MDYYEDQFHYSLLTRDTSAKPETPNRVLVANWAPCCLLVVCFNCFARIHLPGITFMTVIISVFIPLIIAISIFDTVMAVFSYCY